MNQTCDKCNHVLLWSGGQLFCGNRNCSNNTKGKAHGQ